MPLEVDKIEAVVFDYGATLIEFTERQIVRCDAALGELLRTTWGPYDEKRFATIRDEDRRRPYFDGYRENRIPELCVNLVRQLYEKDPTPEQLEAMVEARRRVFVEVIEPPDYVEGLLGALGGRYRLGLLSNYPCGESIRGSLERTGIGRHLAAAVVSADVGFVKPHRAPFEAVLRALDVPAERAVYVGDNWLADVQGAKGVGMAAVLTRQWQTPERFDPQPGDHEPDLEIGHLTELLAHLGVGESVEGGVPTVPTR